MPSSNNWPSETRSLSASRPPPNPLDRRSNDASSRGTRIVDSAPFIAPSCQANQRTMSAEAHPAVDIAALTARMGQGDETAYRMFYELYFHRLLRYLLVVSGGREETAREALQLALLRVVRHIRRFELEETFWSWLTVLARSAVVDEERKRHRYLAFLDRFLRREQIEAATNFEADARLQELLTANLDTLPWEERELIQRKYF